MSGALIALVVGAIVGGITAAISGGDIMDGMLVGAIGGVVMYGVTAGIGSILSSTGTTTTSNAALQGAASNAGDAAGYGGYGQGLSSTGVETGIQGSTGGWANLGASLFSSEGGGIGGALAQGALTIGGNILKSKDAAEEAAKAREHASAEAQASREAQMAMQAGNIEAEQGMWDKRLAQQESEFSREMTERRRQFDVPIAQQEEERNRQRGVLAQVNAARQGYLDPTAQGIDVQAAQEQSQLLAAKQGDTPTTLDEEIQAATGAAYA